MNKFISALFIFTGLYTASFAQKSNGVAFGLNAGFNEGYVQASNSLLSSTSVGGFNLGASADFYFSDRWSFKAKLIYDQKGWGNGFLIAADGSEIDGVDFKTNYLTVPLMANWHFGRTRNWYLHFGPYVGFLLSAQESNDNTDVKSAFNSTDFGFDLGIGVKFPVAQKVKLFIEADGQSGVINIFKQNSGSSLQAERSSLNFGVNFDID